MSKELDQKLQNAKDTLYEAWDWLEARDHLQAEKGLEDKIKRLHFELGSLQALIERLAWQDETKADGDE